MINTRSIPKSWIWLEAEELCEWITKGTTPARQYQSFGSGQIPFIKVYNLTFDTSLDFETNPTFIPKQIHSTELKRSTVYPGDVLMNIVGPPLGKVSIVPDIFPEWNINQAIAVFRSKGKIMPEYLAMWLSSDSYLDWAMRRSKATAGQRNLTLEICRDSPIPLPDITEQYEIVLRLKKAINWLSVISAEENEATHLLDRLDQANLAKAFLGELVPQDPNDEPASTLLDKIRLNRKENQKVKRFRKRESKEVAA